MDQESSRSAMFLRRKKDLNIDCEETDVLKKMSVFFF